MTEVKLMMPRIRQMSERMAASTVRYPKVIVRAAHGAFYLALDELQLGNDPVPAIADAIQEAKAEERARLDRLAEAYARQLPTRGLHGEYARFHIRALASQISGEAT